MTNNNQTYWNLGLGPGGVGSNFIASLNAKLAPQLSPRTSRRSLEEQQTLVANANKMSAQSRMGPGQCFLDSLNAKLAQQHIANAQNPQMKANKIRQLINSRAQVSVEKDMSSIITNFQKGARKANFQFYGLIVKTSIHFF